MRRSKVLTYTQESFLEKPPWTQEGTQASSIASGLYALRGDLGDRGKNVCVLKDSTRILFTRGDTGQRTGLRGREERGDFALESVVSTLIDQLSFSGAFTRENFLSSSKVRCLQCSI